MKNQLILFFFLIYSCEMVLDIDPPPHTKSLVVGGLMVADSMIYISVKDDRAILDNTQGFNTIKGASVAIYEEGELFAILQEVDTVDWNDEKTTIYLSYEKPTVGKSYRLEIEKSGFENISAVERVPRPPVFDVEEVYIETNEYDNPELNFKIKIDDSPGADYYNILVSAYYKSIENTYDEDWEITGTEIVDNIRNIGIYFENELIIEDYMDGSIFTDILFDGREYNINLIGDLWFFDINNDDFDPELRFIFELRNISEATYNFLYTSELYRTVNEDFTAEPVQVYSNIENGKGIFGSYSSSFVEFIPDLD